MTLSIELQRVGKSSSSLATIPLEARIRQGGRLGENILRKQHFTDIENAKSHIQSQVNHLFREEITIDWDDRTEL